MWLQDQFRCSPHNVVKLVTWGLLAVFLLFAPAFGGLWPLAQGDSEIQHRIERENEDGWSR